MGKSSSCPEGEGCTVRSTCYVYHNLIFSPPSTSTLNFWVMFPNAYLAFTWGYLIIISNHNVYNWTLDNFHPNSSSTVSGISVNATSIFSVTRTNQLRQSLTLLFFWQPISNLLANSDSYSFRADPESNHVSRPPLVADWSRPLFPSCLDHCQSCQLVSLLLPLSPFSVLSRQPRILLRNFWCFTPHSGEQPNHVQGL